MLHSIAAMGARGTVFQASDIGAGLQQEAIHTPSYWQRIPCRVNGTDVTHICGHVPDARAHVTVLTGLKATAAYYVRPLRALNRFGISFDVFNLSDPGTRTGFLDEHSAIAEHALFGEKQQSSDIPNFFIAHSAGGLHATKLLLEPETAQRIAAQYDGAILLDPFFTHSSNPVIRALYNAHATINAEKMHGEALVDRLYTVFQRMRGEPPVRSSKGPVQHRQNLEMIRAGSKLLKEARAKGFPQATLDLPITVVVGKNDFVACPVAATQIGGLMGADVRCFRDAWHNPLLESQHAQRFVLQTLLNWAKPGAEIHLRRDWDKVSTKGMPEPSLAQKAVLPAVLIAGAFALSALSARRKARDSVTRVESCIPVPQPRAEPI
jgi:hypothetical protein